MDTYHGVRVPHPYRWMKEMDASETCRWAEEQDGRARVFAAEFASRTALCTEVARLAEEER